jgi:hypothetical protein
VIAEVEKMADVSRSPKTQVDEKAAAKPQMSMNVKESLSRRDDVKECLMLS